MASASTAKRPSTWDLQATPPEDHTPAKQRSNFPNLFATKSKTPAPAKINLLTPNPTSCPPILQRVAVAPTSPCAATTTRSSRKRLFQHVDDSVDDDCRMLSQLSLDNDVVDLTAPKNSKMTIAPSCAASADPAANSNLVNSDDNILLTESQMELFVARMLAEHDKRLVEAFEAVMVGKLTEQLENFTKFTNDQIQRNFQNLPLPDYMS